GACQRFLGYHVELRGNPGLAGPDLIATAQVPGRFYRIVLDAKSRANGHLPGLDVLTLVEYKQQHKADYAVVVAGSFADGKMVRHAQEQDVTLLTIDALSEWVRLHVATPLP